MFGHSRMKQMQDEIDRLRQELHERRVLPNREVLWGRDVGLLHLPPHFPLPGDGTIDLHKLKRAQDALIAYLGLEWSSPEPAKLVKKAKARPAGRA